MQGRGEIDIYWEITPVICYTEFFYLFSHSVFIETLEYKHTVIIYIIEAKVMISLSKNFT